MGKRTIPAVCGSLACAALACALAAAACGCDHKSSAATEKPSAAPPVPVRLANIVVRPDRRTVEVVGTLFGDEDTTISNKVPGKVIAIFHDVGDRVTPGEPLAQLLQKDYELDVAQKRMAFRQALARLGHDQLPPADFDVTALPPVRRARLEMENSRAKYDRARSLHEQRPPLMSDQDFADFATARDVTSTAYDSELLTARALVLDAATKRAELDIAEQALSDTTVRVPFPSNGYGVASTMPSRDPGLAKTDRAYVVSARLGNVGELKALITPMFKLVDDNPMKLRASVAERYFTEVQVGQPARVRINAYPGRQFTGAVARKNPQIDSATRMFPVEIQIANADHLLPPGSFANATIETGTDAEVVYVPQSSVVNFAGENKVFTVTDGKAEQWQVEMGERHLDGYRIDGKGERLLEITALRHISGKEDIDSAAESLDPKLLKAVTIAGTSKLIAGAPVTIVSTSTAQASSATTRPASGPAEGAR